MVLAGEDRSFHSRGYTGIYPLTRIQIRRIEDRRIFLTIPPFSVCEGVDREMDKSVKLRLLPSQLPV